MAVTEPITLWRCTQCGKWSHAVKRPRRHQRWVPYGEPTPDPATVIRQEPGVYDHMNGFTSEGGWFVVCGPFEEWLATKAQPS